MMQRVMAFVTATLLVLGAAQTLAHENFRIIGTLTRHLRSNIDVKSKDGKTTSIRLDKQTVVLRDKKKVDVDELKAGQSVVVDAYGDDEKDLLALEVRIVPPIVRK